MKNFFKAIGKAILFLLLFFGIQFAVTLGYTVAATTNVILENGNSIIYEENFSELVMTEVMGHLDATTIVSNALTLAIVWLFYLIRKKKFFNEIQLNKCSIKNLVMTLLFGVSFTFVLNSIISLIPFPDSLVESFMESHSMITNSDNVILSYVSTALFAPVVEEVIFRGLIYTRLKSGMNIIAAAAISSLMFGVLHGEVIWIITAFFYGLAFVWIFEKTKSLLAPIVIHIANNALSLLTSETEIPDPIGYAVLGICAVVTALTVMYFIRQKEPMPLTEQPLAEDVTVETADDSVC